MPILRQAVLQADSNGVSLSATDLDVAIIRQVVGDTHESGACLIPVAPLLKGLQKVRKAFIEIETEDTDQLEINARKSEGLARAVNHADNEFNARAEILLSDTGRAIMAWMAFMSLKFERRYAYECYPDVSNSELSGFERDTLPEHYGEHGTITITAGTFCLEIMSASVDEFPPIADISNRRTMDNFDVHKLAQVYGAVSTEEDRYNLGGIFLDGDKMVATDGRRAYVVDFPEFGDFLNQENQENKKGLIVPRSIIGRALCLRKQMGDVTFFQTDDQIGFSSDEITLISRPLEGEYPDYNRVTTHEVYPEIERQVAVDASLLIEKCLQIDAFTEAKTHGVKWTINGTCSTIECVDPELGTVTEQLPVTPMNPFAYSAEDYTFGVNVKYLIDAARTFGGELLLTFRSSLDSVMIDTQDGDRAVIMPMRL